MQYEEVNNALLSEFPALSVDKDDIDLPYVVAGCFTSFLLNSYLEGDKATYFRGLQFIETLYLSDVHKIRELATVGYLESIQNTWPSNLLSIDIPFSDLGAESKKWWTELNLFWDKKIKYLGESFKT